MVEVAAHVFKTFVDVENTVAGTGCKVGIAEVEHDGNRPTAATRSTWSESMIFSRFSVICSVFIRLFIEILFGDLW